jgi:hypothetical protein
MAHRHPLYTVWSSMRKRCNNPNDAGFKNYGARGITVCERWDDFLNFVTDMGERAPGMTLGRVDNNGPYSPENCRWETQSEQGRNTRANRLIDTMWGRITVTEAAERRGFGASTLLYRVRRGWPPARLFAPLRRARLIDTPLGRLTVVEARARSGLSRSTLNDRMRLGWSVERLFSPRRGADRSG